MTTRRKLAAVAAASLLGGVALPSAIGLAAPSRAASPTARVVVLAGSADYLVYAEYGASSAGVYSDGTLQVLGTDHTVQSYGPISNPNAPDSPSGERYSIVGSILTANSPANPRAVQWWDLAGAGGGTGTLPRGAVWAGSTPTGWAFVAADHQTVTTESTDGTLTSYGQPVPAEKTVDGGGITAVTGPAGVVSVGRTTGLAAYQTWTGPTTVVPLNAGTAPGTEALACDSVSTTIAACTDTGPRGADTVKVTVPLNGGTAQTRDACAGDVVADGSQLVYVCGTTTRHATFVSGPVAQPSGATVGAGAGVSALGRFVTVGATGQRVVGLRSADAPLELLVTVARPGAQSVATLDAANLRAAAYDVEAEALNGGALSTTPSYQQPAQILLVAADALITQARAADPSLAPHDTTSVMGPVPAHLVHRTPGAPRHFGITRTRTLQRFSGAVADSGSTGFGLHRRHGGAHPGPAAAGRRRLRRSEAACGLPRDDRHGRDADSHRPARAALRLGRGGTEDV